MILKKDGFKLLALAAAVCAASTAYSEENKKPRGSASALMEEVTVISRKRSAAESVQDVPLAITAYGQEQIEALYLKDLKDLSFSMPSVQTDESGTFAGVQNFTIRGQGINSSIPSVDPTVGVFIDGMFLGVSYGAVMDAFDLESIEVLRGPQGLLFGRNVTGGAIVMRTARPDGEFGLKARARVSTGLEKNIALSVENGLTDNLAGKITLYWNDDDGYWDSITSDPFTPPGSDPNSRSDTADGDKAGQRTNKFARGTLVWDATDDLTMTLIGETGRMDGDGTVFTAREQVLSGEIDTDEAPQDDLGLTDMEWNQLILESQWNVGNGVVTNIMGYRDIESSARSDIDGRELPIFNAPGDTNQDQFSNELRYAFTSEDGKWDITTGLYYFEQNIEYREERFAFFPPLFTTITNTVNLGGDMDHTTWGVFSSADYQISDAVRLTAGLRYTKEEKDARVVNADPLTGAPPCQDATFETCQFDDLDDSWENLTPKLGVDWKVTEDTTLYALYTKGFRSGGVNFRNALPSIIDPGPTKEEEQDAFEIGFKSDLLDNRLRLNGAVYHVQVSDMQRELNVGATDFGLVAITGVLAWQATANVGDVDITGAELELAALLTDNLSLTSTLGYVDSEYKSISQSITDAEALTGITLIGDDLPRLSPWTGSIGLAYDLDLSDAGLVTFRANYAYRDPAAYNDSNTQVFRSKRNVNASIQWVSADSHWSASIFGKNLNDEVQWGSLNGIAGFTSGGVTKGRVYGAEVAYQF